MGGIKIFQGNGMTDEQTDTANTVLFNVQVLSHILKCHMVPAQSMTWRKIFKPL